LRIAIALCPEIQDRAEAIRDRRSEAAEGAAAPQRAAGQAGLTFRALAERVMLLYIMFYNIMSM
jgi:hypothetical protein